MLDITSKHAARRYLHTSMRLILAARLSRSFSAHVTAAENELYSRA